MIQPIRRKRKEQKNKKIINTSSITMSGVDFKSHLEERIYSALKKRNIDVQYEPVRIKIWDCDKLTVPYFDRKGKTFKRITSKPVCISYKPDFVFQYKGYYVYLEAKGFKNDVFPYKAKLFRQWLEEQSKINNNIKYCYAVVYTTGELETLLKFLDEQSRYKRSCVGYR